MLNLKALFPSNINKLPYLENLNVIKLMDVKNYREEIKVFANLNCIRCYRISITSSTIKLYSNIVFATFNKEQNEIEFGCYGFFEKQIFEYSPGFVKSKLIEHIIQVLNLKLFNNSYDINKPLHPIYQKLFITNKINDK